MNHFGDGLSAAVLGSLEREIAKIVRCDGTGARLYVPNHCDHCIIEGVRTACSLPLSEMNLVKMYDCHSRAMMRHNLHSLFERSLASEVVCEGVPGQATRTVALISTVPLVDDVPEAGPVEAQIFLDVSLGYQSHLV